MASKLNKQQIGIISTTLYVVAIILFLKLLYEVIDDGYGYGDYAVFDSGTLQLITIVALIGVGKFIKSSDD